MTIETPSPPSANRVNHVDALPPGTRLSEFEIRGLLGVGGFGMVYEAFDHSLHRAVAIKEYMPSALAGRAQGQSLWVRSSSDQQSFQAGLASFMGEARLLAQFDHPSLVKVFRFWEANNTAYMVMPLYTGMTLKQARAHMRSPPPEAWLRKVLWSVLGALRVLHAGHTLHRDISPDNIFLQDSGPAVLLDLGAARRAINDQGRQHTAVLKVNYAPIEQYNDGDDELRQGPWGDLYSLAAMVHGCLCNDTPLPATMRSVRDRMVPFARVAKTVQRQFGATYCAPFVAAIDQALALRPEDRPQSIDAFLQTMDMATPPVGIAHFDFRAELGDIWVEPADPAGVAVGTPAVDMAATSLQTADLKGLTQRWPRPAVHPADTTAQEAQNGQGAPRDARAPAEPDTLAADDMAETVFIDVGDPVFEDSCPAGKAPAAQPAPAATARPPRTPNVLGEGVQGGEAQGGSTPVPQRTAHGLPAWRRPSPAWLASALFALVVAAGALWWAQGRSTPRPAQDIITELKEPPTMPLADAAASAASEHAMPANPAGGVLVAGKAEKSAGVAVGSPSGGHATAEAPGARPAVQAALPRRTLPEALAPMQIARDASPPLPDLTLATPRPKVATMRAPGPQEACADASFLARPLCVFNECKKPGLVAHPVCVEVRLRQEADEQRRQMQN